MSQQELAIGFKQKINDNESDQEDEDAIEDYEFVFNEDNIKQIYSNAFFNDEFVVILTQTGNVYCKGYVGENAEFEGSGDLENNGFQKIKQISNAKFMATGMNFIIVIDEKNNIYGCGCDYGQFGNFKKKEFSKFTKIMTLQNVEMNIKFITCGSESVFIITKNNKILFGGDSTVINGKEQPIIGFQEIIELPNKIKDLKAGFSHAILLDYFGNIYGSGKNNEGQLGLENFNEILTCFTKLNVPFKVKKIACCATGTLLLSGNNNDNSNYNNNYYNNELYASGFNDYHEKQIIGFKKITLFGLEKSICSFRFLQQGHEFAYFSLNNEFYCLDNENLFTKENCKKLENKLTRKWKYQCVVVFEDFYFFIGSNCKVNGKLKNCKVYERLYLQLLDNISNCLFDITIIVNNDDKIIMKRKDTTTSLQNNDLKKRKIIN
ncbi:hypothetical protein ABK040_007557 [Willaertia magna]